jgi:hypothetical protein
MNLRTEDVMKVVFGIRKLLIVSNPVSLSSIVKQGLYSRNKKLRGKKNTYLNEFNARKRRGICFTSEELRF